VVAVTPPSPGGLSWCIIVSDGRCLPRCNAVYGGNGKRMEHSRGASLDHTHAGIKPSNCGHNCGHNYHLLVIVPAQNRAPYRDAAPKRKMLGVAVLLVRTPVLGMCGSSCFSDAVMVLVLSRLPVGVSNVQAMTCVRGGVVVPPSAS
jgi:hypothetical protein